MERAQPCKLWMRRHRCGDEAIDRPDLLGMRRGGKHNAARDRAGTGQIDQRFHPAIVPHADAVKVADRLAGLAGDLVGEDVCMGVDNENLFHIKPSVSFSGQPYTPYGIDVKRAGPETTKKQGRKPFRGVDTFGM